MIIFQMAADKARRSVEEEWTTQALMPWTYEVVNSDCEGVTVLLEGGRSVNCADAAGLTALHIFLIEAGANVNIANVCGQTALMKAVKHSYGECVDLLMKAGAIGLKCMRDDRSV